MLDSSGNWSVIVSTDHLNAQEIGFFDGAVVGGNALVWLKSVALNACASAQTQG